MMSNKSRLALWLTFLQLTLLLTGCWDSVELNRRAIVSGVSIDRGPTEDTKYKLSFQVIVSEEISGENARSTSPVALYTGSGRSMYEALSSASSQTARFLSLGHIRVIVISEAFAREGIKDIMDVLERESDMRLTSLIFISHGQEAVQTMSTMTVFSKIPSNDLVEKLDTTSKLFGYNFRVEVDDVVRGIQMNGGGPIINGVYVSGNLEKADSNDNVKTIAPQSILRIAEIAAFKGDKLKGWLDGSTAIGTSLLHNTIRQYPVLLEEGGGYSAFSIYKSQVKVSAEGGDAEHPVIRIKVTQQAALKESTNGKDLTQPRVLTGLADQLTAKCRSQIEAAIAAARKLESDYLGFGEAVERSHPRGWKKVKDRWDQIFRECEIVIEADTVIRHTDMRSRAFEMNR
ncbi:Ger(x)C family spore germination protein [Paenibacillus donghaensis]|nr:Ger(x)C family spore germination protein [Paenibacillus donghaensis]